MNDKASLCPCNSGKPYGDCCGPYIAGEKVPPTPEALMRSRYSAYAVVDVNYLEQTLLPGTRDDFDPEGAKNWAQSGVWTGLEIRSTEGGEANDDEGYVEFVANYTVDGKPHAHHETSRFVRQDGRWWYVDGVTGQRPRRVVKVGRNDPCLCGSGKKYKKCCGLAA